MIEPKDIIIKLNEVYNENAIEFILRDISPRLVDILKHGDCREIKVEVIKHKEKNNDKDNL
jgi:hypothetical protein